MGYLNNYTGAAAGFSLRKLSSTSTYAIRVRRTSDNTEMNIGFDGSGNLDTTALTTFVGVGDGYITTWYDQSGLGRDAIQTIAGYQPQIVSGGIINTLNNKPAIKFGQGTSRYLYVNSTSVLNIQDCISTFSVANFVNSGGYYGHIMSKGYLSEGVYSFGQYDTTNYLQIWAETDRLTATLVTNKNQQYLFSNTNATGSNGIKLYQNGTLQGQFTTTNDLTGTNNYQFNIGRNNRENSYYLDGNIQEIVCYPTYQQSNLSNINGNINTYYSIYTPLDSDASAFITAASLTDATQISAVNTLVTGLKSAGIWSKMKAIYPFVGGNSTAHSKNLVNPSLYNLTFSSGWVHNSNGSTSNSSYANTGIVPSSVLSNYNSHMSLYNRTSGYNNGFDIGVIGSSEYYAHINHSASYPTGNAIQGSRFTVVTTPNDTGLVVFNRTANNLANTFIKTNKISTSTATSTSTLSNNNIFIGALNWVSFGGAVYYSNRNYAFSSIGDGLTDSEAGTLNTLVQAFQTTLGRQV